MTFDSTLAMIGLAKKIHEITDDIMLKEAIKILAPLLGMEGDTPLSIQQQSAAIYISRTIDQYHGLFGYPSEPGDAA